METLMEESRLNEILKKICTIRIGVIGDYCLDAYWTLDTGPRELSIETGKPTWAVTGQSYRLGGAGNLTQNLFAIGVKKIYAMGVVGDDIYGREMLSLFHQNGIETNGVTIQTNQWQTSVYTKPHLKDDEQERIDFGRFNIISPESENTLIQSLETILPKIDGLIVNQQLPQGIYSNIVI